jgi:hypothetical protein
MKRQPAEELLRERARLEQRPAMEGTATPEGTHSVLQLQRALGNRAVSRLLHDRTIQARLKIAGRTEPGYKRLGGPGTTALMPDRLRGGLEQLSGFDLSGVKVHFNSFEPVRFNALAHTQGEHIHLLPGQEKHLPHEGWHVVQQMQGRVRPTLRAWGTAINSDRGLEQEADVMGARALHTWGSARSTADAPRPSQPAQNGPVVQRWVNLGTERWKIPAFTEWVMTVWTGTKEEWMEQLDNIDDEDEYEEDLVGFLRVSNDPSIVNRTRPPSNIGNVPYSNTITRAPNDREKLEFLRALYEMGGSLDLWRGSVWEGGPWTRLAERDLSTFITNYQGMLIADVSARGEVIGSSGVRAVAEQAGRKPTMAMIINAGATAHKGVDLIVAANRLTGRAHQVAHATAMETIRNSGRVIRAALKAHDARVAFEQQIAGIVFDQVWSLIPGGGQLTKIAMGILKAGLKEGLKRAQAEGGPSAQAERINDEFVAACNRLVRDGHIDSPDAQDAINGFEAVRR